MVSRKQWEIDVQETRAFAQLLLQKLVQAKIPRAKFHFGGVVRRDGAGVIVTPDPGRRQVLIEPKYAASFLDDGTRGQEMLELCLPVARGLLLPVLAGKAYEYVRQNNDPYLLAVIVRVPPSEALQRLLARHRKLS